MCQSLDIVVAEFGGHTAHHGVGVIGALPTAVSLELGFNIGRMLAGKARELGRNAVTIGCVAGHAGGQAGSLIATTVQPGASLSQLGVGGHAVLRRLHGEIGGQIAHVGIRQWRCHSHHHRILAYALFVFLQLLVDIGFRLSGQTRVGRNQTVAISRMAGRADLLHDRLRLRRVDFSRRLDAASGQQRKQYKNPFHAKSLQVSANARCGRNAVFYYEAFRAANAPITEFSPIMSLFRNLQFVISAHRLDQLPATDCEIAVAGRSNAGKSSAINTLAGHTRLAYVSKTPGRTQLINHFQLRNGAFLVDLPGYGYAQVPAPIRAHWGRVLGDYLQTRESLVGLVLIMDSRHPLKDLDWQMINWFVPTGKPIHVLLTKSDKLSTQIGTDTLRKVRAELKDFPQITVQLFSSLKKSGIEETERVVGSWLQLAQAADAADSEPAGAEAATENKDEPAAEL